MTGESGNKTCGECAFRFRPECPRREYRDTEQGRKLNEAAVLAGDPACEKFKAWKSVVEPPAIVWNQNHVIHPALDFTETEAYVTVPLAVMKAVPRKKGDEGDPEVKKVQRPIVVTSSAHTFEATMDNFRKLDLSVNRLPVIPGLRWSRQSIKRFLEEGVVEADGQTVYEDILEKYQELIDFADPDTYDFVSLWVIGTYFFPLFETYPYVYFGGLKRTGKTKTLTLTSLLAFNSIFSSNMTSSALFRLIENARSTLLIDETEGLNDPGRRQDFRSILLAGYKKGNLVYRTHKDKHVPEGFGIYGPKMIANIRGLEDILEDRCIIFIMLKTTDRSIGDREVKTDSPEWQRIRDDLYLLMLTSWREVKGLYEGMENATDLADRNWELWKPILTLAKWLGIEGLYDRMVKLALRKTEEKRVENVTETGEAVLIEVLYTMVTEPGYYAVKTVRDSMANRYDEEQKWLNTRWVGRALKRLGFTDKRRVGTGVEYRLGPEEVRNRVERLGIAFSEVSEVSVVSEVPGHTLSTEKTPIKEEKTPHPGYSQTAQTTQTTLKRPCDVCDSTQARLHLIPRQGEKWLCDHCLSTYEGDI